MSGPSPARIAYLLTQHPRTTQTFVNAEIAALRERGHHVSVFAMNRPAADQVRTAVDREEQRHTVYLKDLGRVVAATGRALATSPRGLAAVAVRAARSAGTDLRRVLWRLFHLAEAALVWSECTDRGVQVVHAHFGQSTSTIGWLATWLGRELGQGPTDLVITVHCGTEVEDTAETIPAEKVRDARAVIAVSDHTRSQLMRHVPAARWEKLHVIRCGIDLDVFTLDDVALDDAAAAGDPPTVLFVGRLDPAKGVPVLLEAARALRRRGSDLRLEIVGSGSLEAELHTAVAGDDWVRFLGELSPDQVRDRVRRADVFCLPSLDEGIPVSIMEAMAVGTPVVTTAVAGIPELARHDDTALVVPAGNPGALADALERLLTDSELRERLVPRARQLVTELHDRRVTLPQLIELLTGSC